MQFDLRAFLEGARKPYEAHFQADLTQSDFGGYTLAAPAECDFTATPTDDGAALLLCVKAQIHAECARCLEPLTQDYCKVYAPVAAKKRPQVVPASPQPTLRP